MHPLVEVRPVARAAVVGRGRDRLEACEQLVQLAVGGLGEHVRVRVARCVPSASTRPGSDRTMKESVITSRASVLDARCSARATTPTTAAAGRRTTGHQRGADGKTALRARADRDPACVAYGASSASRISGCRRVCSWRPISRFARRASSARLLGSRSRPQTRRSARTPGAGSADRRAGRRAGAGRGSARLPGHRPVRPAGTRGGSARTRARSPRRPSGCRARRRRSRARTRRTACAARGVRRPSRVSGWKRPRRSSRRHERRERMQQPAAFAEPALEVLEQVLAADRSARLPRGPRRVRAPVRALAVSRRERRGETRVAVGDLEVADDRASRSRRSAGRRPRSVRRAIGSRLSLP